MSKPLTAMERLTQAQLTAATNGEAFTAEAAARVMEAHAAAAVAEVTRERDEAIEACSLLRGDYQSVIDRMDALGYPHHPEHQWRDTVSLRLSEMHGQYHNALARVAELEAALRNARHAIADSHANINESRTQRALRCLQLVAREIESVLAPQAPPARKEGE